MAVLVGLLASSYAANIVTFTATPPQYTFSPVCVSVPAGYKLVGGGVNTGGAYIGQSYPINATAWCANYQNVRADVGPSIITTYALGLYDPDNHYQTAIFTSTAVSTASVAVPSGYTLVGGGANTQYGFLYESYPNTIRGDATSASTWTVSAAANPSAPPNSAQPTVTAYAIGLKPLTAGYSAGNVVNNAAGTAQNQPNSSPKATATATALTPAAKTTSGGFRGSSTTLAYASYPSSSNGWTSAANGQGATITSYDLGVSFTEPAAGATTGSAAGSTTGSSSPSCSAAVSATARNGGSWSSNGQSSQIYDLVVTNTGSCKLTAVRLAFTGAAVSQKWNLDDSYNLQGFGGAIYPGANFNGAGVVVTASSAPSLTASVLTKGCDCSA